MLTRTGALEDCNVDKLVTAYFTIIDSYANISAISDGRKKFPPKSFL